MSGFGVDTETVKATTINDSRGKVWLVGAGPSDVGLFTLKGKAVLGKAQVVVYDALVGSGILSMMPEDAEKIYVGKRAGNHAMTQEQINALLVQKAKEGKRVVRLKGGDPFLFGRGGEELLALRSQEIDYEVVPGVSSALAVPAYNGIPVTHRDCAGSVHIITGHRRADEPLELPFEAYVKAQGTLVFLMGLSALPDIVHGLLAAGMDAGTPAAVLEKGTTGRQRRVIAALGTLEAEAAAAAMQTPAIIVVGAVAALGISLAWYEKLPLFGHCFVLTRPSDRMGVLAERLRENGAEVIEAPAIETHALPVSKKIQQEIDKLCQKDYDCLVFTSPAGVHTFFEMLCGAGRDVRVLCGIQIAVIGSGTRDALRGYGILADLMPERYDGIALGTLLGDALPDGSRVLIARSDIGNPKLVTVMEARAKEQNKAFAITDLSIYKTVYKENGATSDFVPLGQLLDEERLTGVFFTSASTVRGFVQANPELPWNMVQALCIGELTAQAARAYGMQVKVAEEASVEGLLKLAERI